jgi:hypothetical protein
MELLREIFLYSVEVDQMKSGQLASVCRHWRSVITSIASLWSTLTVSTWTEREQVATWLQRAYPKKVVIDTQRDGKSLYEAPSLVALQDALKSTVQWNELTIASFPPESLASQLDFHVASPMNVLRTLHVGSGCVHLPSFTRLLDLVPTEAPLSVLRLLPPFASAYFLQPLWFPVLQNLTVLTVNGEDIHDPFALLPAFTQLHTFEADHLLLPWYELDTNLPLLCTLQKLRLRACSVQWMAGRQFQCLEECAIFLPRHWEAVQQYEVQLPSCRKLAYHGYPMVTVQYFHVPQMRAMELRSHDQKERRVYQQLHHLCTMDGNISKLTTLHLTLQCSEQAFIKVMKYLGLLQELVLSTGHPSSSWQCFLESLAAKPSRDDLPDWIVLVVNHQEWEQWCSSQTWYVNILPHLKYLGIQCPKGFSQSECLDNWPLLRFVGWTRAQLSPPLEHLKVWEGRGTTNDIAVDYISTGCLDKLPGVPSKVYDSVIIRGMVTQRLVIDDSAALLLQLHSTALFRRLQDLEIKFFYDHEIPILPCLEQITRLEIWHGIIPAYSLNIDLPLTHTLRWLRLDYSTFSWMLGRTFKALREFQVDKSPDTPESQSRQQELQVCLPFCTTLKLRNLSVNRLHCFSCPNIQVFRLQHPPVWPTISGVALKPLHDFLWNCSCLQKLEIVISQDVGLGSFIQSVFYDARKQGVWRDIRSVEAKVRFTGSSRNGRYRFFSQTVGHQQGYKKWWKECTVTMEDLPTMVIVSASM